jgi:hypothetical protein
MRPNAIPISGEVSAAGFFALGCAAVLTVVATLALALGNDLGGLAYAAGHIDPQPRGVGISPSWCFCTELIERLYLSRS